MTKNNLYKYIIWVEDFDNKNVSLNNMPTGSGWDDEDIQVSDLHDGDIKETFGDTYAEYVNLFMRIPDVLNFIDQNLNSCDCVVLDVNLNKAIDSHSKELIVEKCREKGVEISQDRDIGSYGGYYIYLYLLRSGFPTERICIFTGNKGDNNSTGTWEKVFLNAGIVPPKSIQRTEKELLQNWLDNCYGNQYYRIRRLIYKSCEYWKEKIKPLEKENISFNQIYYPRTEDGDYSIEPEVFISMLERVEMLFPVTQPCNCGQLYYQALQVATIFHEESAKITKLDKNLSLKKYHQAVRNFRNWSAHNKFNSNEISAELFAYMFCITLRTYFQEQESQFAVNLNGSALESYKIYEKEFFDTYYNDALDAASVKSNYVCAFCRHLDKVKKHDKKSKKSTKSDRIPAIYECKDINELLLCSGTLYALKSNEKMYLSDLLLSIIDGWIVQENKFGCQNNDNTWEYIIKYQWNTDINDGDIQSVIDNREDYFKHIAYVLFEMSPDAADDKSYESM